MSMQPWQPLGVLLRTSVPTKGYYPTWRFMFYCDGVLCEWTLAYCTHAKVWQYSTGREGYGLGVGLCMKTSGGKQITAKQALALLTRDGWKPYGTAAEKQAVDKQEAFGKYAKRLTV